MTLNEWEQSNIEVLTSREMGEWLCRRENRLLEQISDEVNKLKKVSEGNKVYVGINDVLDIIDKYKGDKE